MRDILEHVESLKPNELHTSGNWTPAQIVAHVNQLIVMSLDGFHFRLTWLFRAVMRPLRGYFLKHGLPSGVKFPKGADDLAPPEDISWVQAVEQLRAAMRRLEHGERMNQPSPVFGKLTHEQWEQLHCRHAELHFGFMHPASADSTAAPRS